MATERVQFDMWGGLGDSSNPPQFSCVDGTNFPVKGLAFDASTEEIYFFMFEPLNYGAGSITLRLRWYADSASSGVVKWGAAVAAITPNTDSQDIETDAFDTASTVTDTHLGTTGQRVHECEIEISDVDSVEAGDVLVLKVYRDADDAADTMTGDAILIGATAEWSDT